MISIKINHVFLIRGFLKSLGDVSFLITSSIHSSQNPVVEFLLPFFERALKGVSSIVEQKPNGPLYLADFGVSVGTMTTVAVRFLATLVALHLIPVSE